MELRSARSTRVADPAGAWPEGLDTAPGVHQGSLDGATLTGEACRRQLAVRVGLWLDETGWVRQARWRGPEAGAVRDYAEAACALLEAGADPARLDAESLRAAVAVGPANDEGAELVAGALAVALAARG
jgi:hypothetical protein